MRFVVTNASVSGRARAGALYVGGGGSAAQHPIETPALLLSTLKGLPHFVSPDLLAALPLPDSFLLHVSPVHFLDGPSSRTISNIGGLHQMLGLHEHALIAAPRDSIESLPASVGANKLGASFETPSGRMLIKPSDYMGLLSSLKPNMSVSLADEVPAWVSEKRNRTSVERTIRWLDCCLALDPTGGSNMLGAIVGASSIEERKHCAIEVASRNVSGFWIGGFGLGESMEERSALLNAVTDNLPEEKLRMVSGLALPEEVLQGVAAGVDLFDSTYFRKLNIILMTFTNILGSFATILTASVTNSRYIYHLTLGGFALVFPLSIIDKDFSDVQLNDTAGDFTKINLRATIYRKDVNPIDYKCSCFTCQNHTKAYIHHLLNVHEMLAQTLLEIHNTHHYLGFFRSMRESIKLGEFEVFCRRFIESRRAHLSSAVPDAHSPECSQQRVDPVLLC